MQFSMSLAVFAAAVSALPQPLAVRKEQEPRVEQESCRCRCRCPLLTFSQEGDFGTEAAAKIIPVIIGGQQVTMVPNLVTAAVGDIVQFQFANGNHTVTQSSETAPCTPLQNSLPGAVHSGHIPFSDGQTTVGTFNMPVLTTEPMFIYCATGPHCQLGQMMVINPKTADQVVQYFKVSNQAKANVDAKTVAGGTVAQIPLAQAAFQPAPPEDKGKGGAAPPPAAPPAAPPASSKAATSSAATSSAATSSAAPPPPAAPPVSDALSNCNQPSTTSPAAVSPAPPATTAPPAVANPAAPAKSAGTTTTTITVQPGAGQIPAAGATPVAPAPKA
ncbi:uncharacterized protein PG986_001475 [Apiospora aurea]|uniref:Extracellular serine-rich protein n=1 Tax=Apiospora aurea TaxID=335848 RepID=A0ABR1QX13_9PEZI